MDAFFMKDDKKKRQLPHLILTKITKKTDNCGAKIRNIFL